MQRHVRRAAARTASTSRKSAPPASSFTPWQPRDFFHFEVLKASRKSRARVGRLHTPHGHVDTPGFVVVGTNGAVKFVDHAAADAAGMQLMFSNTVHLLLHPGTEPIERAGGLHRFIGREHRPIITDSGGFQIFSFANRGEPAMPGRGSADMLRGAEALAAGMRNSTPFGEDELLGDERDADSRPNKVAGELKSSTSAASRYSASNGTAAGVRITEEGAHFRSCALFGRDPPTSCTATACACLGQQHQPSGYVSRLSANRPRRLEVLPVTRALRCCTEVIWRRYHHSACGARSRSQDLPHVRCRAP